MGFKFDRRACTKFPKNKFFSAYFFHSNWIETSPIGNENFAAPIGER